MRVKDTPYRGEVRFSSALKLFSEVVVLPVELWIKTKGESILPGDGQGSMWRVGSGLWRSNMNNRVGFQCGGNSVGFTLKNIGPPAWVTIREDIRGTGVPAQVAVTGGKPVSVVFDNFVRDPSLRSAWSFRAEVSFAPGSPPGRGDSISLIAWTAFCRVNSR
jgi:hypothetical protein